MTDCKDKCSRKTLIYLASTSLALCAGNLFLMAHADTLAPTKAAQAKGRHSTNNQTNTSTESTESTEKSRQKPVANCGSLLAFANNGSKLGECPLENTSVEVKVSGFVARVKVKQRFSNTFHTQKNSSIEAIYTFPLSEKAAVDRMMMKIGEKRVIEGEIKKREEARKIYEEAKSKGHVAALLDQERPNIFTQSVANIAAGEKVEITIEYVELLPFENGRYTFAFPTVVGPRFIPGNEPIGRSGTGWSPDTDQVGDASKITPPVTPPGTRAGHDLSISVDIDAGISLKNVSSKLHQIKIEKVDSKKAHISLASAKTIPNKDFVLSWDVSGTDLKSGYLVHKDQEASKPGYFTLMLVPPERLEPQKIAPKEMIFLIDCSGSQYGKPLDKAKETLHYILDKMNPQDTFQIISFNNTAEMLFEKPVYPTSEMKSKAKKFIDSLTARGGTWMAPAVEQACKLPADKNRLRIVTFMTDGYVGNDMEVVGLIKKLREKSRWFPFGTGNSVNRFLIERIATEGGGEADYVFLNAQPGEVAEKFYKKISSPVLTDIKVKFEGVNIKEVFPNQVSDVWAQKPLYLTGRYTGGGAGTVTLSGYREGKPYVQKLAVVFPESAVDNPSIPSVWARNKVDMLMSQDWSGLQYGTFSEELKSEIVDVALAHRLMTQFTSFVAVEIDKATGKPPARTIVTPVEMPEGVSRDRIFGREQMETRFNYAPNAPGIGASKGASARMMGKSLNRAQFYNSPRQAQILDHRPAIQAMASTAGFSRKEKKSELGGSSSANIKLDNEKPKPRAKSDDSTAMAKLSPILRSLYQTAQAAKKSGRSVNKAIADDTRFWKLAYANGALSVKLTLKSTDTRALELLQQSGFRIIGKTSRSKNGNLYELTGMIAVEKLIDLASPENVLKVEEAS